MNYTLLISAEAEKDLAEAKQWYQRQQLGLGEKFLACVESTFERIHRTPEIHAIAYKNVRRTLIRRFPYVVYYRVVEAQVTIVAVLHSRRHPRSWKVRT